MTEQNTEMVARNNSLPTLADIYEDDIERVQKIEKFTMLLSKEPKDSWVKVHPFINGYKYLPIDKVEHLLRVIFKQWKIEITGQGVAFNGVWVTVRVHYLHPITNEWLFHDGIGAEQLQTKKGCSAADLAAINNGALKMAFPLAKAVAVKDACDHFGTLFGANLNRKEVVSFTGDASILKAEIPAYKPPVNPFSEIEERLKLAQTFDELDEVMATVPKLKQPKVLATYNARASELEKGND